MATVTIEQGKLKGGSAKTDSGVQYYEFLCVPYGKPPLGDLRFKEGTAHGDDTTYVFKHAEISKFAEEKDITVRTNVTKMWTDFAKTGVPTSKDSPLEWPAYTSATPVYLNIDAGLSVKSNYEPKKLAAFKAIYDKYEK